MNRQTLDKLNALRTRVAKLEAQLNTTTLYLHAVTVSGGYKPSFRPTGFDKTLLDVIVESNEVLGE